MKSYRKLFSLIMLLLIMMPVLFSVSQTVYAEGGEETEEYKELTDLVVKVQDEIKRNRNHNQIDMVKLDEVLQRLFDMLDISNIAEINEELKKILAEAQRINAENEAIAMRYNGSYAFVKTYTDAIEIHPDLDREIIAKVVDVVFEILLICYLNFATFEVSKENLSIFLLFTCQRRKCRMQLVSNAFDLFRLALLQGHLRFARSERTVERESVVLRDDSCFALSHLVLVRILHQPCA